MYLWYCSVNISIIKKAAGILKKLGFKGGEVHPCLFVHKSSKETMLNALYIDVNLLIGDTAAIHEAIQQLKQNGLILKIDDVLTNFHAILFSASRRRKLGSVSHI